MNYNDFIGNVQNKAKMPSQEEAIKATRATLETLSERLAGGEPHDIAAQLPDEIAVFMKGTGDGEQFDSNEFLNRVSKREGMDLPVATYHVRVVFDVLKEAVTQGGINHLKDQLPNDYHRFFEGSEGKMPNA